MSSEPSSSSSSADNCSLNPLSEDFWLRFYEKYQSQPDQQHTFIEERDKLDIQCDLKNLYDLLLTIYGSMLSFQDPRAPIQHIEQEIKQIQLIHSFLQTRNLQNSSLNITQFNHKLASLIQLFKDVKLGKDYSTCLEKMEPLMDYFSQSRL